FTIMKYWIKFLLSALLCCTFFATSQAQIGINADNSAPAASAMLDISASDKGLLIPRMSSAQRMAISTPANGLMVYDQSTRTYWYYDNERWNEIRDGSSNLSVFDFFDSLPADFSCLTITGNLPVGSSPKAVAVVGNYAYVVDDVSDDLKVINIGMPNNPSLVGSLAFSGPGSVIPRAIAVVGNYAYVVDGGIGDLKVIDISNPSSPSIAGSVALGIDPQISARPVAVAVAGNYAYVLENESDELVVINVSNPGTPTIIQRMSIGTSVITSQDMTIAGNYAYVVESTNEDLQVIDISNPSNPSLVGRLTVGETPEAVAVAGNYAYVLDRFEDNLRIIDIANPASPVLAGSLPIGGSPTDIAVSGFYAYVVDEVSDDLKVIDVSNPASPNIVRTEPLGTVPTSLALAGNYVYVVDRGSDDLKVIQLSCSAQQYLLANVFDGSFSPGPPAIPSWTVSSGNVYRNNGNVGIGTSTVNMPLSFPDVIGNKIALFGSNANQHYGFGMQSNLLQIHSDVAQSDIAFGYGASGNFTERMRIKGNGNVGIGTTTPRSALDVNGNINISSTTLPMGLVTELNASANPILNLSVNSLLPNVDPTVVGGIFRIDSRSTGSTPLFQWIRKPQNTLNPMPNDVLMTLTDLGYLGVGVANPTRGTIEVGGAGELQTASNYGFLDNSGAGTNPGSQLALYSLYAGGSIAASLYYAFSDARIKRTIQRSDSQADLNTLMAIQITDYQHIDTIQKGDKVYKKVIAQQVAEVFPLAVSSNTREVVPDIYQRAIFNQGWIELTTDLQLGDRVKIITPNSKGIHEVTALDQGRFRVLDLELDNQETIFVYGREVDDFHTVDYEAIAMLNVSATQEQQNLIEQQSGKIQAQQATIEALENLVQSFANQQQHLRQEQQKVLARLARLESELTAQRK
ncbi:MAG: tail fiber domain-containing protein, partial [Bacteroidota bacterium]